MKREKGILLKLFISMISLGTFTFGGGYVIVTLMKRNLPMNITGLTKRKCWI